MTDLTGDDTEVILDLMETAAALDHLASELGRAKFTGLLAHIRPDEAGQGPAAE